MAKFQILVKMPVGDTIEMLASDVVYEIEVLRSLYPSGTAPGTQDGSGYRVVYAVLTSLSGDILGLIEGLIVGYELDWTVYGLQDWFPSPVYDEDMNIIDWACKTYMPLNMDVLDFIPEKRDEDDNIIPATLANLTTYQQHGGNNKWQAGE